MVYFYGFAGKRKKKVLDIFSVDPALGLINIAVSSMDTSIKKSCWELFLCNRNARWCRLSSMNLVQRCELVNFLGDNLRSLTFISDDAHEKQSMGQLL